MSSTKVFVCFDGFGMFFRTGSGFSRIVVVSPTGVSDWYSRAVVEEIEGELVVGLSGVKESHNDTQITRHNAI